MVTVSNPEELAAAVSGPAIYADKVIVSVGPMVRVSFMEQAQNGPIFRSAVALPYQVALQLAEILKTTLAEIEKQIAEEEAKAAKTGADPHV